MKKIITLSVSALLLIAVISSFAVTAFAEVNLDYSKSGDFSTVSVGIDEFVGSVSGVAATTSETTYLTSIFGSLEYSQIIPDSYVSVSNDGHTVFVNASNYSYTASNGVFVSCVPASATYNGKTVTLSSDGRASFDASEKSQNVEVTYSINLTVASSDANSVINRTYNDASDAIKKLDDYEKKLDAYNKSIAALAEYQVTNAEYQKKLREYNDYLSLLDAYNEQKKKYNDYLEDLKKYEADKKKYDDFKAASAEYEIDIVKYNEAMKAYNEALKKYEADYADYSKKLAEQKALMNYLSVIDSCFATSSEGHQFYATLTGGTVSSVIANRSELEKYAGVSKSTLDEAASSTDKLSYLLSAYSSLDTDKQKFEWYKENYSALSNALSTLYGSIYTIFTNDLVAMQAEKEGKSMRFCQFASQLYVISRCLDDSLTLNESWFISTRTGVYSLYDVLESDFYMSDDNNKSVENISFTEIGDAPLSPAKPDMAEPKKPAAVTEPLEPSPVTDPEKPAAIAKPVLPDAPEVVEKPVKPTVSFLLEAVIADVRNGNIKPRAEIYGSTVLTYTTKLHKFVNAVTPEIETHTKYVITYVYENSVIGTTVITDGVAGNTVDPPVISDGKYNYRFECWVNADGYAVDIASVNENTTVYPKFTKVPIEYKITWITAGGSYETKAAYGTIPSYNGKIPLPIAQGSTFSFSHWSPAVSAVTCDAAYTAVYTEEHLVYNIAWNINGVIYNSAVTHGTIPRCPVDPTTLLTSTDTYTEVFAGWDSEPSAAVADMTYTAIIKKVTPEAPLVEILESYDDFDITVPSNVYEFDIAGTVKSASSKNKSLVITYSSGIKVTIRPDDLPWLIENDKAVFKYTVEEKAGTYSSFNIYVNDIALPGGTVINLGKIGIAENLKLRNGELYTQSGNTVIICDGSTTHYELIYSYHITSRGDENVNIQLSDVVASPGDKITLNVTAETGYKIGKINIISNGKNISLSDDGKSFIMPNGDVSVYVEEEKIAYTVSFYIDGALYSTGTYSYGDRLPLPDTPKKASKDNISYVFSGWSPAVVESVVGDAEYRGAFLEIDLSLETDDIGASSKSSIFNGIIGKIIIVFAVFLVIAVVVIIIAVSFAKPKKYRRKSNNKDKH